MTAFSLTPDGCLQRRRNLWARLPDDISWVLLGDARHVQYFSNFRIHPLSFSADQRSLLLLQRSGQATLLADNFTRRTASADPVVDDEIIISWYTHRKSVSNRDHALMEALTECRETWTTNRGLIEVEGVTALVASAVNGHAENQFTSPDTGGPDTGEQVTLGEVIRQLRRQKLPDEVDLLQQCMAAGDAGHAAAFEAVRPGVSELDVYMAIQQAAQQCADGACVVYGDFRATNAAQFKAGGLPTTYVLQPGDLMILDYSVILHGYRSDFTNTIAVGTPSGDQVRQFEACRDALLAAEKTLAPGVACRDVYEAASGVFLERGYPALAHHCGHGLGMEHPEAPILVPESTDTLMDGDVVTLEPGLYVEGVGGMRFEHNYVVRPEGGVRLSNHHIGLTPDEDTILNSNSGDTSVS